MRHNIRMRGHAFELRPIDVADADFMVSLRTDPDLSRLIHPTSPRVQDQRDWIERYFERPGDYYFIVVRTGTGREEGAVAIQEVDVQGRQAEWGRWVLRKESMGAPESALLIYRAAFDLLDVDRVYCRTAVANANVVAFHTSCGLRTMPNGQLKHIFGGVEYGAVEQYVTRDGWPVTERTLEQRAQAVARLLNR